MGSDTAAMLHQAADIGIRGFLHAQRYAAVVDEDAVARLHLARQLGIGDGYLRGVALHIAGSQGKFRPVGQHGLAARHILQADLRPLGIQHHSSSHAQTIAHGAEALHHFPVRFMGAMRKVKPGHVHARAQHGFHHFFIRADGAQGADNLGLSHCNPSKLTNKAKLSTYIIYHKLQAAARLFCCRGGF